MCAKSASIEAFVLTQNIQNSRLANLNLPAKYKRSRGRFDAQLKDSGMLDEVIRQSAERDKL